MTPPIKRKSEAPISKSAESTGRAAPNEGARTADRHSVPQDGFSRQQPPTNQHFSRDMLKRSSALWQAMGKVDEKNPIIKSYVALEGELSPISI